MFTVQLVMAVDTANKAAGRQSAPAPPPSEELKEEAASL